VARGRSDSWLYLIGTFKLVKALVLIGIATGALELLRRGGAGQGLYRVLTYLPVERNGRLAGWLVRQFSALTPHRLLVVSIAAAVYGLLFAIEGIGLVLRRRWGEIVTVIITSSFIPLEVYEAVRRASIGKAVVIALNLAVVGYLIWRLRGERKDRGQT
jgi:uncharacterized membrane protein (DUF2068 family)